MRNVPTSKRVRVAGQNKTPFYMKQGVTRQRGKKEKKKDGRTKYNQSRLGGGVKEQRKGWKTSLGGRPLQDDLAEKDSNRE